MQYRTMPGKSEQLSALGYGCMRLPTRVGGMLSSFIDKKKAVSQISYALERGVNYLDTAYPYHMGASESFLGEHILTGGIRQKVYVATKLPCIMIRDKEQMETIFSEQLQKLKTDYIDYYLLHALDGKAWDKMVGLGVIEFMDKLKKSGAVRYMGFSFHGPKEDFFRIVDGYTWDFTQVQYNILDEKFQAGIEGIDYAYERNMGVIIMEPLRGGALVGKIPKAVQKIYNSSSVKKSPVDWALRWIWNNPKVTMILSGMNNLDHVNENIRIAREALPESMTAYEIATIQQVRDTYKRLLKVGCTGCGYCMPCPQHINIPAALKNLNAYHLFSKFESSLYHALYLGVQTPDGDPRWTSCCNNCGKCEKKCPQQIQIRDAFKQVQKDLEGPFVKFTASVGRGMMSLMGRRKK